MVTHYAGKERFSDRQQVMLARGFIVAIVLVTYLLSLLRPGSVFALGVWCFSGFAALFPLVFAAIYWKRLTKWGAYASVIVAFGTWAWFFGTSVFRAIEAGNPGPIRTYTIDFPLGDSTHEVMPVVPVFVAALLALVIVSLMTRPPSERALRRCFSSVGQ